MKTEIEMLLSLLSDGAITKENPIVIDSDEVYLWQEDDSAERVDRYRELFNSHPKKLLLAFLTHHNIPWDNA